MDRRTFMTEIINILKVRDDHEPIYFKPIEEQKYIIGEGCQIPNWFSGEELSITDLRGRIEPWLTSLFQSEHLSLLIGSGLSTSIQVLAGKRVKQPVENSDSKECEDSAQLPIEEVHTEESITSDSTEAPQNGMGIPELDKEFVYSEMIHAAVKKDAEKNNRGAGNIEDYFRVINDLLRGLEIIGDTDNSTKLKTVKETLLNGFISNISEIENCIAEADEDSRTKAFNNLVMFLMSFASRTGTRDRLQIFTTNYDRVIEAGSELAGLHLLDRFIGSLSPIFRSSRLDIDMHYNPPGIRGEPRYLEGVTRFTKLHGSIDWVEFGNDIRRIGLPFGAKEIAPYLKAPGLHADSTKIMIFPNSSKDRETAEYPYVELFRDFSAAICRPNSTLVTYGYSFGDDHINRIIRDMLTIPSTHLVIIAYEDTLGRIIKNYEEIGRPSQISLLIGPDLADIEILTNYFLPKPSIDRTTIRMSELLKQRYSANKTCETQDDSEEGATE